MTGLRHAVDTMTYRRLGGTNLPAHSSTTTVFMFTNSRIPGCASSRPNPESPMPPKGRRRSLLTASFTKQHPAWSRSRAICSPRTESRVKTAAPKPKVVSLAIRIASDSSRASIRDATGPKVSSR